MSYLAGNVFDEGASFSRAGTSLLQRARTKAKAPSDGPLYIGTRGDAETMQGQLVDMQQKDFEKRFIPLENRLIETTKDKGEAEATRAGNDIGQQAKITRASFLRDLSRSGTQLTDRQNTSIERASGLDIARSTANAENQTRRTMKDENMQTTANLIGIGRDVQQGINSDLSAAAGMQASREAAGRQAKSAEKAQTTSMVATGLGMAAAFFL